MDNSISMTIIRLNREGVFTYLDNPLFGHRDMYRNLMDAPCITQGGAVKPDTTLRGALDKILRNYNKVLPKRVPTKKGWFSW